MTIHTRAEPDYNGWTDFETFIHNGHWWWSACDDYGDHKGFREGPFRTEDEARIAGNLFVGPGMVTQEVD